MTPLTFTATVQGSQITVDGPLPDALQGRVLVTVEALGELDYDDSEITDEQWRVAMSRNPALAFLHDPAEDVYTLEDGQPFRIEDYLDEARP